MSYDSRGMTPGPAMDSRQKADAFFQMIVKTWTTPIIVLTRRYFGRRYFDFWVLLSLPWFWFWVALVEPQCEEGLLCFVSLLYILCLLSHSSVSQRKDLFRRLHTRYDGWPWLCDLLKIKERTAKQAVEPFMIILIALSLGPLSPGVSSYLFIGSLLSMIDFGLSQHKREHIAMDMRDAEVEMNLNMQTFDDLYGD